MELSRANRPLGAGLAPTSADAAACAPFLFSVDPMAGHLQIFAAPMGPRGATTAANALPPSASLVEAVYPLSTDFSLRTSVSDLGTSWSTFRLSKFLEAVDALTADVAYRHTDGIARGLTLVTAGHYHSRKMKATDVSNDVSLRCYVTAAGGASMEIRTDALQRDLSTGDEVLVNVCHTTMVALDKMTMRPAKGSIPPIEEESLVNGDTSVIVRQNERTALAKWHNDIRKTRGEMSMQIRLPFSTAPSESEMAALHAMHRAAIVEQESALPRAPPPRVVGDYTYRSSFVVFPEQRNVHGKLFGGWVAAQSYNLAFYAAKFFAQGGNVVPLGLDEAVFLLPITIGDLVTFTARVCHATKNTARVFVTVEVRHPGDPGRLPKRSNRLMFVFGHDQSGLGGESNAPVGVVPQTYSETLMHFEGSRRSTVEGPSDKIAQEILSSISYRQEK